MKMVKKKRLAPIRVSASTLKRFSVLLLGKEGTGQVELLNFVDIFENQ